MGDGGQCVMICGQQLMLKWHADSLAIAHKVYVYTPFTLFGLSDTICVPKTYTVGAVGYTNAHFGQGTGPILLDNLGCSGSESRLVDCSYDSHTADCSHSEDAGIRCRPCKCPMYSQYFLRFQKCLHKDSCDDGELRLVGGLSPSEGQVEMCLGRRWGSVNDDIWSTADIEVVCRQFGYTQGTLYTMIYAVYILISHNKFRQHKYTYSRRGIQWIYTY